MGMQVNDYGSHYSKDSRKKTEVMAFCNNRKGDPGCLIFHNNLYWFFTIYFMSSPYVAPDFPRNFPLTKKHVENNAFPSLGFRIS